MYTWRRPTAFLLVVSRSAAGARAEVAVAVGPGLGASAARDPFLTTSREDRLAALTAREAHAPRALGCPIR